MPAISEMDSPLLRSLIMPEKKSWTPPASRVPKVIHRKTMGPHRAPWSAPKMGPRPAMFSSCTRNSFHWGRTT